MPSRRAWPRIGLKIFRLVDFIQVLPIRYWGERSKWSKSQYCQTKTNFISRLALSPVITKRGWSKRFLEWSESLKRRDLATNNLQRSAWLRKNDWSTNYVERSERPRKRDSSEGRDCSTHLLEQSESKNWSINHLKRSERPRKRDSSIKGTIKSFASL